MSIRVLIADDQELVREGLAVIIGAQSDLDVVGQAVDGADAVRLATELAPDVILMDIRMPGTDGLEATRLLLARPEVHSRILILTTFDADEHVLKALLAGASGFLLKDVPKRRLVEAIRAIHDGEMLLASAVTRRLVARHLSTEPGTDQLAMLQRLSTRERDVLGLVTFGATNPEIAAELFLSESTIKTYVGSLLHKLAARDRVQLVIFGHRAGVLPPTP